ncbi:MAG: NAD(P)/FAD-dependent oxidoreductase [Polyangiales bacterium]
MTDPSLRPHYDVVIVGARVAGAATAMRLAEAGLRVLVFDKGRYGADTLSTHALMRPAVMLLDRWGVLPAIRDAGTPAVRKTTFRYSDDETQSVQSIDIRPRHGVDSLFAPRRTVLDRALVDAAEQAGADVRFGMRFVELLGDPHDQVRGVIVEDRRGGRREIGASLVIGADGRSSRVAASVGAAKYTTGRYASATVYGYFAGLPVDGNRWYYRPGMGAGAIPTNQGDTLVFASIMDRDATSPRAMRNGFRATVVASAPDLGAALDRAELRGKMWFFPGMVSYLRQPWGSGWALVGDAGYMSDPITAHGITNALRDAELLSRAVIEHRHLGSYQLARDDLSQTFFEVSDRVASYDWDIPTVQQYHRIMSQEMKREEDMIVQSVPPRNSAAAA